MTQPPAGWYPEPDPAYAGQPGRLRYWDGQSWTEHVHEPAAPAAPPVQQSPVQQPPAYPAAYPTYEQAQQQYGQQPAAQQYPQYQQYPGQPVAPYGTQPYYADPSKPATADGVTLAGWWWRVLARLLDTIFAIPLYIVAAVPVIASQWDELGQWFDDLTYAADHNTANPPDPAILDPTTGPGAALALSIVAAYVIYEMGFLAWKQATPGKLVLGMRVRLRDEPGLPWSAIVIRVSFIGGLSALGNLPVAGFAFVLLSLLDYLWPLWDSKKQALHDKVARTNVVKPDRN